MVEIVHPVGLSPLGVLTLVASIGSVCALLAAPVFASSAWRTALDALLGALGALLTAVIFPMYGYGPATAEGGVAVAFAGSAILIGLPRIFVKIRDRHP